MYTIIQQLVSLDSVSVKIREGADKNRKIGVGRQEPGQNRRNEKEEEEEQTICDEGRANIAVKEERTKP